MTSAPICFTDTETTGLDPDQGHDVWELAIVRRDLNASFEVKALYQVRPDLEKADPKALEIGGFNERFVVPDGHEACRIDGAGQVTPVTRDTVQRRAHRLLRRSVVVGSNPGFDAAFLKKFLEGATPWHYRPVDVIAMAATRLGLFGQENVPWRSEDISRRLGVEPPGKDTRHTALGDALWVRDMFDAIPGHNLPT